ncbi:MAG: TonB family protein [Gemmatimonadota bacterium]
MRNRIVRSVWISLWIGTSVGAIIATPRHACAQTDGSLLKSDLVRMMTGDSYSAEEVLQIVRMNCVGFAPSDRDRKDLARLFDGDDLLVEIDRCREAGRSAGYRRGIPVAKDVAEVERPAQRLAGPDIAPPVLAPETMARPELDAPPVGSRPASDVLPGVVPSSPPRLLNWDYVTRRILTDYRPDERHRGSIVLRIWVDDQGRAGQASIVSADGDPSLAQVALASVPLMRFAPAESRDRRVGAWATLPIQFNTD